MHGHAGQLPGLLANNAVDPIGQSAQLISTMV